MPYKLRGRFTQEDWYERQRAGLLTEEECDRIRAAGTFIFSVEDLELLRDAGALDWNLAGSMMFQNFIDRHGSPEEKDRLTKMHVGYRRKD